MRRVMTFKMTHNITNGYHPPTDTSSVNVLPSTTFIEKFLTTQVQPSLTKVPEKVTKSNPARVLTSHENRKILEEKELKKKEAAAKKAENLKKKIEKQQIRAQARGTKLLCACHAAIILVIY